MIDALACWACPPRSSRQWHLVYSCARPLPTQFAHSLLPGLVETSTNLASIKPVDASAAAGSASVISKASFAVQCSTRSTLMPALEQVGSPFGMFVHCVAGAEAVDVEAPWRGPVWCPCPALFVAIESRHARGTWRRQLMLAGWRRGGLKWAGLTCKQWQLARLIFESLHSLRHGTYSANAA